MSDGPHQYRPHREYSLIYVPFTGSLPHMRYDAYRDHQIYIL